MFNSMSKIVIKKVAENVKEFKYNQLNYRLPFKQAENELNDLTVHCAEHM